MWLGHDLGLRIRGYLRIHCLVSFACSGETGCATFFSAAVSAADGPRCPDGPWCLCEKEEPVRVGLPRLRRYRLCIRRMRRFHSLAADPAPHSQPQTQRLWGRAQCQTHIIRFCP